MSPQRGATGGGRQQRDYRTESPLELRRQLQELEGEISAFMRALPFATMAPLAIRETESQSNGLELAPGSVIGVRDSVVRVQLAPPRPVDAGRFAALYVRGSASIELNAPSVSAVNTASSYTWAPSAASALLLLCDGLSYWTVG